VRENQRDTAAGFRTLVNEVNAFPHEVIESVKPLLPGAPVELLGPVRGQAPQPFQFRALLPPNAGELVRPSRTVKACSEIREYVIRDVNAKLFHRNSF
jgi:hypothetical protein